MTDKELVDAHTSQDYVVAFVGFAPGFAYLSGGDLRLDVPRKTTPRTRVPAGAVGLAGTFSAVYPQASPGGWQLIGTTHVPMWDLERPQPALLQPGFSVRFTDAGASKKIVSLAEPARNVSEVPAPMPAAITLVVRQSGIQALFQDLGRYGQAGQGVSASGAMDQAALRTANRLVGNAVGQAALELADSGFELEAEGDVVIAVTGATGALKVSTADGRNFSPLRGKAFALSKGDRLRIEKLTGGMRSYLAVRGGFQVTPVLGSCATDTLAHIGPSPIKAGDRLGVCSSYKGVTGAEEILPPVPEPMDEVVLDVVLGPRTDWFSADAVQLLLRQRWTVTPQSNRVGLRLNGEQPLTRCKAEELASEGTVLGAIQVPPSGQPVLFLADHPLTGGYPVIGSVALHHLDLAGQIPVGAHIRFNLIQAFVPLSS
jgi:biotin-dependent carboxylase-like uncharacterized protein